MTVDKQPDAPQVVFRGTTHLWMTAVLLLVCVVCAPTAKTFSSRRPMASTS